jgi:hypothetical protein
MLQTEMAMSLANFSRLEITPPSVRPIERGILSKWDGIQLRLEQGQTVIPHGPGRDLDVAEAIGKPL